ncbi:endonuclease domain-containing protein [Tenuifilum thalassicum]|uniref:Endonuclease domain-containing protein n=1 Tax=Tenuifilum thalassicum TaxID=2590900 RepID=A0A7D4C1B0_9BACT|nr:endonuclease domain-containing protein [Tenuifilum thalassicum]QKG80624.1 endonuclease domain-containing protein [Tenuifilum thalassicum]
MKKSDITILARQLRRNSTPSEMKLWEVLRNKKFEGLKFYRQRPIIYGYQGKYLFFIADFYCAEKSLVIELDGEIHNFTREYDQQRDLIIQSHGLKVLRIRNDELKNIEHVLQKIKKII